MTATNHALTGAVIGLSMSQPWLAIPLAFCSHFVLDAIPHFGFKGRKTDAEIVSNRWFKTMLIGEACICFAIVLSLFLVKADGWILAALCAFFAASPDLYSAPRFFYENGWLRREPKMNIFRRFHSAIQTERIWGLAVEAAYFVGIVLLFSKQLI